MALIFKQKWYFFVYSTSILSELCVSKKNDAYFKDKRILKKMYFIQKNVEK